MIHDIIQQKKAFKNFLVQELNKFFKTKSLSLILNDSSSYFKHYNEYKLFLLKEHDIKSNKVKIKRKLDLVAKNTVLDKKNIYLLQQELSNEVDSLNVFNQSKKEKLLILQKEQAHQIFLTSKKILLHQLNNNPHFLIKFNEIKEQDTYLINYCQSWKNTEIKDLELLNNQLIYINSLLTELIELAQISLSKETLDGQLKDQIFSKMSFQANLNLHQKNIYFYELFLETKNTYPKLLNEIYFQKFELVEDSTHLVNFASSNNLKQSIKQKYKLQKFLSYLFKFQYFLKQLTERISFEYQSISNQKNILLKAGITNEEFSHLIIEKWLSYYMEEFKPLGNN